MTKLINKINKDDLTIISFVNLRSALIVKKHHTILRSDSMAFDIMHFKSGLYASKQLRFESYDR